jgi:hypothetical protein
LTIRAGATTRATVEMTTGAIVMMTIRSHWVVVQLQLVRGTTTPKTTHGIVTTIHECSSAIATPGIAARAASIRAMYS